MIHEYNGPGGREGEQLGQKQGKHKSQILCNNSENVEGTKVFTLALDYSFLTCLVVSQQPL